jgi:hypothetical protein
MIGGIVAKGTPPHSAAFTGSNQSRVGNAMDRKLYCVARGHGNEWEALCLDFDLAVQGRSFEDVKNALHGAIVDYVKDVCALPPADRDRLLARSAPWHVWILWKWRIAQSAIRGWNRDDDSTIGFPVPCHA